MGDTDVAAERGGSDHVPKTARNNLLCSNCRRDKQACEKSEDPAKCIRCKVRKRDCDGPHLALAVQVYKPSSIQLVTLLLRDSRLSVGELYKVMFRRPRTAERTRHASEGTHSHALNEILQPKYGLLRRQIEALSVSGEILNGIWPGSMKWYYSSAAPRDFKPKPKEESLLTMIKENLIRSRKPSAMQEQSSLVSASSTGTFDERISAYHAISVEIGDVLEQIMELIEVEVPGSKIQFRQGFPPSHIAYMAGDIQIAFRFWEHNPPGVDILGRTLGDLATEHNDFELLRSMDSHPAAGKLSINHKDARGLTALEIATILGLPECLDHHLRHQRPIVHHNQQTTNFPLHAMHLFELALAACFARNVDLLITHGYAAFDCVSYFGAAIELRRPELVARLKKRLFDQCSANQGVLDDLASHADREADRVQAESTTVWKFWEIDDNREEWLRKLEELRRQGLSLTDFANSLRQRSVTPSTGQAAVESIRLAMPFSMGASRRGSNASQVMDWSRANDAR